MQLLAFKFMITQVSVLCVAVMERYGFYGSYRTLWQLRHVMAVMARYDSHNTLWKLWHVMAVMAVTAVTARYVSHGTLWQLWHVVAVRHVMQSWHDMTVMTFMARYGSYVTL